MVEIIAVARGQPKSRDLRYTTSADQPCRLPHSAQMHPVRPLRRLGSSALRRLAASAEPPSVLEQTALERARADTAAFIAHRPIVFTVLTACAIAAATAVGTVLGAKLPLIDQILVAAGSAIVGVFVPVTAILASSWVLAFPRQRREALAELKLATRPSDLAGLAHEFSAWAAAKDAARPRFGGLPMEAMFQNDHPARTLQLQRNDELARLDAEARGEYHQRFRDRITTIVGEDWPEPRTTSDLVALAGRVQTLAGDARSAEAIAAAQGTPITSDHLTHLQALRERIHLDISNQQPSRYGDDQNRESFFAHNKTLQPLVEKWDEAMENRDARIADLAAFIPQEVARCQLVGPAYIDGAVADCFSENILASFRRRDYGVPTLQLACRLGVAGENPENLWSAHLHSGTREYAVRLLPGPAELTTEGVAEYHRAVVAPIESELQACYAGIYGSAPASRVKAAQQALQQLSQPLLEEWRLQQISGATPAFSSSCPYCLAGLRI